MRGLCPRCGSKNLVIAASENLRYKCVDCGYTWGPLPMGYVSTKAGELHWTELKRIMDNAINDAKSACRNNPSCEELVRMLSERYGNYLTLRELVRIAILSMISVAEEVRFRDKGLYAKLHEEASKCRELVSPRYGLGSSSSENHSIGSSNSSG